MIDVTYVALTKRGISEETCKRFKYGIGTKADGTPVHVASYGGAQKYRTADKQFSWANRPEEGPSLFGQNMWRPQKRLVVTEGEIDALSYGEATDCRWPVVSVPDGAGDAPRAIARNIEFVEAFEEVIFLFDMDEPGQQAAKECAALLTPGKARIGTLPRNDANEVLLECGAGELYKAPFSARVYRPDGIVEGVDLIEAVMSKPPEGLEYPWPALSAVTHGQRRGEMTTWIAGTGVGKSAVLREVAFHLHAAHGERVGIIALEESNQRSALGLLSIPINRPLQLAESRALVEESEIRRAAEAWLPGFAFYDHFGSVEADVLLPKIRFMAHSLGIRWFVLDHLSIMVSGMAADGDERKRLDQLATQLRSLCSELDIGLHIVSHLRKSSGTPHEEGGKVSLQDIRGSGAPAQLSDFVIALERNQQDEDEDARDTTSLRVLKNRLSGETGIAGALLYNHETGRLNPTEETDPNDDF
jgi:twinkle protein